MALDLFVNFERHSNSSLFYRVTSATSRTFTIKLSDQDLPNQNLYELYNATYSINGREPVAFVPDTNGFYVLPQTFITSFPCVCSIVVDVTNAETLEPVKTFNMSAVIVRHFPSVDFVAYPTLYVNISTGNYVSLNSSNYPLSSRGVYFYGEGHTEIINLSCDNFTGSGHNVNWIVGNSTTVLLTGEVASRWQITPIDTSTATVSISTVVGEYPSIPINLWATNTTITTSGPFITYSDTNGLEQYYPFFTSSLSSNGITRVGRTTKDNIDVYAYPEPIINILDSPFESSRFLLPLSYIPQGFTAISYTQAAFGTAIRDYFSGTQWELNASSDIGEWSVLTEFLSTVKAYNFKLSYDENTANVMLPTFKASALNPTTLNVLVSSYRFLTINVPPYDWGLKPVCTVAAVSGIANPIPFNKIWTPNYFNRRNQDVVFNVVGFPDLPFAVEKLTLTSDSSTETLVLTGGIYTGSMKFNVLGVVDIKAEAMLKNLENGSVKPVYLVYQDMLEIVEDYDAEPNEDYYHTIYTPFTLSYTEQPKLSPNEWGIADNVNSILEKFHITIQELDTYATLYRQKDKFYAYLEPTEKVSIIEPPGQYVWENPPKVWAELDCAEGIITDETASWEQFDCVVNTVAEIENTWEYHNCGTRIKIDPSCFQKYCVQWNWKWRVQGATDVDITWFETKSSERFAKKWKWERCVIDAPNINCERTTWRTSTIDFEHFPIPSSNVVTRCAIVDAEVNRQSNQLVVAHKGEIHLLDRDYENNFRARTAMSDGIFTFQNIVGLATTNEGKVVVLDNILPRICVYSIEKNDFVRYTNWGSYGVQENPLGFNKPLDVHVDEYNSVWIADTGNNCIKKFTLIGKPLLTITHELLEAEPPLSICVDSQKQIHCLTKTRVIVFNEFGVYLFEYSLHKDVTNPSKINVSYNKEIIYVTYQYGVVKYFRNGVFFNFMFKDMVCGDGELLEGYNSISQDVFRNAFITVGDKILQMGDLQSVVELRAPISKELYWNIEDLKIHKDEYIQPWVYLKSFHRLWDNIELLRNSIFYEENTICKSFVPPAYQKEDLIIGQNEIVTNAVINRLAEQLWANMKPLVNYFNPDCEN